MSGAALQLKTKCNAPTISVALYQVVQFIPTREHSFRRVFEKQKKLCIGPMHSIFLFPLYQNGSICGIMVLS